MKEKNKFNRFVEFEGLPAHRYRQARFVYDPSTKVIYMMSGGSHGTPTLSPYYVVNEEGEVEIAVLGKNYFIE